MQPREADSQDAWLTLQREQIAWHWYVAVPRHFSVITEVMQIRFPPTKSMLPSSFVHINLVF